MMVDILIYLGENKIQRLVGYHYYMTPEIAELGLEKIT